MAVLKRVPLENMSLLEGEPFYFGESLHVTSNLSEDMSEIEKILEHSVEMQLAASSCIYNSSNAIWAVDTDCKALSETAGKLFRSVKIICDNYEKPKAIGVCRMSEEATQVFLKLKACSKINRYIAQFCGVNCEEKFDENCLFEFDDIKQLDETELVNFKSDKFVSYQLGYKNLIHKSITVNVSSMKFSDIADDKIINQFLNLSERSYLLILNHNVGTKKFHTKSLIIT